MQTGEVLSSISIFNPTNRTVCNRIKNSVDILDRNEVRGFNNIKHINSN